MHYDYTFEDEYEENRFIHDTKLAYHHKFDDGFECCVDDKGIIWIKYPKGYFKKPCMKLCYDIIYNKNKAVAKAVLALSCEIQDIEEITDRAILYKS